MDQAEQIPEGYIARSDIGLSKSTIARRAEVLGIRGFKHLNKMYYAAEDVQAIRSYLTRRWYTPSYIEKLEYILAHQYLPLSFIIDHLNLNINIYRELMEYYAKTGCIVVRSRMNINSHPNFNEKSDKVHSEV